MSHKGSETTSRNAKVEMLSSSLGIEFSLSEYYLKKNDWDLERAADDILQQLENPSSPNNLISKKNENNIPEKKYDDEEVDAVSELVEGNKFLENEDYDSAVRSFSKYLSLPLSSRKKSSTIDEFIQINRGISYMRLCKYELAIKDFNELVDGNLSEDQLSNVLLSRGNCFRHLGQYDIALEDFHILISMDPSNPSIYEIRAEVYGELEYNELSLRDIDKAIELRSNKKPPDPELCGAYCKRSSLLRLMGKYDEALIDSNLAISISLNDFRAYYYRGNVFQSLRKYELAILDYNKVFQYISEFEPSFFQDPLICEFYLNRGKVFFELEKYDLALIDYKRCLEIEPSFDCHLELGNTFTKLKKYKRAKKNYKRALEINPNSTEALVALGEVLGNLKEFEESEKAFKKAVDLEPSSWEIYLKKFVSLINEPVNPDWTRGIEDYSNYLKLCPEEERNRVESSKKMENGLEFIYKYLGKKLPDKWFHFPKDNRRNERIEEKDQIKISKELKEKKFNDFVVYRFLGGGAYGRTYVCRVKDVHGVFVMKLFHNITIKMKEDKRENILKREFLDIPCHRNVVPILSRSKASETIKPEQLPDFNEYWNRYKKKKRIIAGGIVTMRFYRKDLLKYIQQRKKDYRNSFPFSDLERCYILSGLLAGSQHLHKNLIVHRDLHLKNVFIDDLYGRVLIGDFGCTLDCRDSGTGFLVDKKSDVMFSGSYFNIGAVNHLAPEIEGFDEDDKKTKYIDYSKCDIYSVGMIGYIMVQTFQNDDIGPYFKKNEIYGNSRKDKWKNIDQERDYNEIREHCNETYARIIKKLLAVDKNERMDYEEAIEEVEKLIKSLEKVKKLEEKKQNKLQKEEYEGEIEYSSDDDEEDELQKAILMSLDDKQQENEENEGEEEEEEEENEEKKLFVKISKKPYEIDSNPMFSKKIKEIEAKFDLPDFAARIFLSENGWDMKSTEKDIIKTMENVSNFVKGDDGEEIHDHYFVLGENQRNMGEFEMSILFYTFSLKYSLITEDSKTTIAALNNRAIVYYDCLNDYGRSLVDFNVLVKVQTNEPRIFFSRANLFLKMGKLEFAIEDFNRVIQLDPNYEKVFTGRAACYFLGGKFEDAIADYSESIKKYPKDFQAIQNRGISYLRLKLYKKALIDFNRAHKILPINHRDSPEFTDLFLHLSIQSIKKREFGNALNHFEKAISLSTNESERIKYREVLAKVHLTRGLMYKNHLKRYREARDDFAKSMKYDVKSCNEEIVEEFNFCISKIGVNLWEKNNFQIHTDDFIQKDTDVIRQEQTTTWESAGITWCLSFHKELGKSKKGAVVFIPDLNSEVVLRIKFRVEFLGTNFILETHTKDFISMRTGSGTERRFNSVEGWSQVTFPAVVDEKMIQPGYKGVYNVSVSTNILSIIPKKKYFREIEEIVRKVPIGIEDTLQNIDISFRNGANCIYFTDVFHLHGIPFEVQFFPYGKDDEGVGCFFIQHRLEGYEIDGMYDILLCNAIGSKVLIIPFSLETKSEKKLATFRSFEKCYYDREWNMKISLCVKSIEKSL